jgi:glycosyltransferase involved in cell wall biosynthesis
MPDLDPPRASVLLSRMRVDPWLRGPLESILNDGYPNIEVILLLDAMKVPPSDAWLQDQRVTLVPIGLRVEIARGLNIGLEMATGDLVARMDADDISLPGRFRAQVDFLQANSRVAVLRCQAIRIDEHEVPTDVRARLTHETAIKRPLLTRNPPAHPSIMFRNSAVLEVGGYNTTAATLKDSDLYVRPADKYESANLPATYLNYREHSDQKSRAFNPFSYGEWDFVHRRHQLARTMKVPLDEQLKRHTPGCGAQITPLSSSKRVTMRRKHKFF